MDSRYVGQQDLVDAVSSCTGLLPDGATRLLAQSTDEIGGCGPLRT